MSWPILNYFRLNSQIAAQRRTIETARPYFLPAVEDTFDLARGIPDSFGLQTVVLSRNLIPIGQANDDPQSNFGDNPKRYISSFAAVRALSDFVKKDATVIDKTLVIKLLDFILACPPKKYSDRKDIHGEQNDPFIYMGHLWKLIGTIAEISPHLFHADEVKSEIQKFFSIGEKLRHDESVQCVSALYFKHAQLTPREYLDIAFLGLKGDADSKYGGIYVGAFFVFLSPAFEDSRRTRVMVNEEEYQPGYNDLCLRIRQQQDELIKEVSAADLQTLRDLARDPNVAQPSFRGECRDLSLKIIGARPDLAIEPDLANLSINTEEAHSPLSLRRSLAIILKLAELKPDWDWNSVHASALGLAEKLKNPRHYGFSISVEFPQITIRETPKDDPTALYLLDWNPEDAKTKEILRALCDQVLAATPGRYATEKRNKTGVALSPGP